MKYIINILKWILNIVFLFFKVFPVKKKVTFISRQSNQITEDFLMLKNELKISAPDTKLVFLCKKLEGNILDKLLYCFHMLMQMYHIATSQVVILDSYCICISILKQRKSLTVIQIWHALGSLKRFGLSIVGEGEGSKKAVAEAMDMHKNYSYILTSSNVCLQYFAEAFGYDHKQMKVMSLPRVDKLTDRNLIDETIRNIYNVYPCFKEKKSHCIRSYF